MGWPGRKRQAGQDSGIIQITFRFFDFFDRMVKSDVNSFKLKERILLMRNTPGLREGFWL
ncbi:MAG TPA: hypothetical protein DD640_04020 [Clostridiales bacterium]|nr:hypothetical protein [Clostridiales bacterium]